MTDLGFCVRRGETVTEGECRRCFFSDANLRDGVRNKDGMACRQWCVEKHIETPRLWAEREAQVVRLQPMLEKMDAGGWQGIVRNVLESALTHPTEETAKNLLRQIEAHAEHAVEAPPDPGDVGKCEECGRALPPSGGTSRCHYESGADDPAGPQDQWTLTGRRVRPRGGSSRRS